MVLKGVPDVLSPELLHALASMGHGDKLVLADSNFPSASICHGEAGASPRLVRADGHSIPRLLEALASLGQGDKIVLASLNFPAASTCRGAGRPLLVRADGHSIPDLLEAIVKLLPLVPKSEVMTPTDF